MYIAPRSTTGRAIPALERSLLLAELAARSQGLPDGTRVTIRTAEGK